MGVRLWLEHRDRPLVLHGGGSGRKPFRFLMKWSLNQSNLISNPSTRPPGTVPYQLLKNIDPAMESFPLHHHFPLSFGLTYTSILCKITAFLKDSLNLALCPATVSFFSISSYTLLNHLSRHFLPFPTNIAPSKVDGG